MNESDADRIIAQQLPAGMAIPLNHDLFMAQPTTSGVDPRLCGRRFVGTLHCPFPRGHEGPHLAAGQCDGNCDDDCVRCGSAEWDLLCDDCRYYLRRDATHDVSAPR